jgi:hypothetical protein
MIWISVLIWCAVVAATADYVRRSIRITEVIDRDHPEIWEKVHFRRWISNPPLGRQASQFAALVFIGFPRGVGTEYPDLREPISKCRDSAYGLIILLAVAIASMTIWPRA